MTSENQEQKKVIHLYSAFAAALVMTLIPSMIFAVISLLFFTGVLIAAYVMRNGNEKGSLAENHAAFIIRTIWIAGIFASVTITAGCAYLLTQVDNSPLQPCTDALLAHAGGLAQGNTAALSSVITPCVDDFVQVNMSAIMIAMAISAAPILLYFIIRFSRGLSRAMNGYRVANPKSWF